VRWRGDKPRGFGEDEVVWRFLPIVCLFLVACATDPGGPVEVVGGDDDDDDNDSGDDDTGDGWEPPTYDPYELPEGMPTVEIQIDVEAMARLDADPFASDDERGVFIDGDGVSHEVDIHYRGAYALLSLMESSDLRNWKVKFDEGDPYLGRREWNFNYEPHLKQKLAYDLYRFAGVMVPGAQHVVLRVNGEYAGMYLQYEDPDSKGWLYDCFGDDDGDLYKAAFDIPDQPQCFADLTWLGPDDEDYECHYAKKTNHNVAPGDYSVLRAFLEDLNALPDEEFAQWLETSFAVDSFRSYLVVTSFTSNWDAYPQRPKNFWLYQDLRGEQMVFVPWDLDLTFNPYADGTYNQMGVSASVLYNLAQSEYQPVHAEEGTERPLVRRLMAIEGQREAYLNRYRALSELILSAEYLHQRADALLAIVQPGISPDDLARLNEADASLRVFIDQRTQAVEAELADLR
jgi:spore coat protein H